MLEAQAEILEFDDIEEFEDSDSDDMATNAGRETG